MGIMLFSIFSSQAQEEPKPKTKYQGLLWEISGNGLEKPSYLYGTMHVSSKLAFNLGDSFFIAIQNADIVGLETTPDTWLDEMIANDQFRSIMNLVDDGGYNRYGGSGFTPDKTFAIEQSNIKDVADLLRRDPRLINSFMFRKSNSSDNFEEDTYLDLYIFRVGRKLGKQVIGVEDFAESQALVEISYDRSYDKDDIIEGYEDVEIGNRMEFYEKFEDAYRRGDLDLLDSLNKVSNPSKKHNKYMLWLRNENMANTMDTIMPNKSMFVGVGAAHLPGDEGVIELLRKKGYKVRPVQFNGRSEKKKDKVDKIKVDMPFQNFKTADGFISVEVPGKMTEFPYFDGDQQSICTDMVNGNYFVITRMDHFSAFFGDKPDYVLARIDSLLFENIPGKILKKKEIEIDGYKGIDILNKTRRGDYQRYNILVTPEEVIVFKLGGSGDYADGKDADRFFKSIKLKAPEKAWTSFSPVGSQFKIDMPTTPWTNQNETDIKTGYYYRKDYMSSDLETGNVYFVSIKPWYFTRYLEEDSFDMRKTIRSFQLEEKYNLESQKFIKVDGRQAIEALMMDKDSNQIQVRSVLRGPNIYLYGVKVRDDKEGAKRFIESFKFSEPSYRDFRTIVDSTYHFSVDATININSPMEQLTRKLNREEDKKDDFKGEDQRMYIVSPNTSEVVFVDYTRYHRYKKYKDSTTFWNSELKYYNKDSVLVNHPMKFTTTGRYTTMETYFTDTGSTKGIMLKSFLMDGRGYSLFTLYDTVQGIQPFTQRVFETFKPMDTLTGTSMFADKVSLFFEDLANEDSAYRAITLGEMGRVYFHDSDAYKLITTLDTCERCKDFEEKFVQEISYLENDSVLPFMEKRYLEAGDTANLQVAALNVMLKQKTEKALESVKKHIMEETPLPTSSYSLNNLFDYLGDTLNLSKKVFPDFMSIIFLPEYRANVYRLMADMVDSGYIKSNEYLAYKTQLIIEARNNIKRLATTKKSNYSSSSTIKELSSQMHLLVHFYKTEPKVQALFDKAFKINISELKIDMANLMLNNLKMIPDTIAKELSKDLDTRALFYALLKDKKKLKLFPKEYRNQDSLVASIVKNVVQGSYGNNADSIILIGRYKARQFHSDGYVYVYRVKKNYGENWNLFTVGLQPLDTSDINLWGGLNQKWSIEWKKKKDEAEQISEFLDEVLLRKRRELTDYSTYGSSIAKYYISPEELRKNR